jgi:hypothetical protein
VSIWDRLGNVIKSYLNDDDPRLFGGAANRPGSGDPDLDAAFEELNDYLKGGRSRSSTESAGSGGRYAKPIPENLRPDFAELGGPFGASADEC